MDIKRFKESLVWLLTNMAEDSPFAVLRVLTHGMAGTRTAKIINFACRCMEEEEFYLEVGTFSGYTLLSASYQSNAMCVGIDDLSLEDIVRAESRHEAKTHVLNILQKNLGDYGSQNMKFIQANFMDVDLGKDAYGKLGVLFVDGKHTGEEVQKTIDKFQPYFAKDAIIIFDDVQFNGIPNTLQKLWGSDDYEMLLYVVATPNENDARKHRGMCMDEYVSNGICVMTRKEKANA